MKIFDKKGKYAIKCFIGGPGSGKSSTAQYIVMENAKKGLPTWSNFSLTGAYKLDANDLGKYDFCILDKFGNRKYGGTLLLDEAGIDFNSRYWKEMSKDVIEFLKLHRHYCLDVYFFSQGVDMDITIRRLAQLFYKLDKPWYLLGKYTTLIPVHTTLVIENGKWELHYEADTSIFSRHFIPIFKTWKYFDSFEVPELPAKVFEKWGEFEND